MAYGTADEALLTVLVMFKKMFMFFVAENRYFGKIKDWDKSKYQIIAALVQVMSSLYGLVPRYPGTKFTLTCLQFQQEQHQQPQPNG